MRLYITVYRDGPQSKAVTFTGTQAEQKALHKRLADEDAGEIIRSGEVEVPTDKAGLLRFLNGYQVETGEVPDVPIEDDYWR